MGKTSEHSTLLMHGTGGIDQVRLRQLVERYPYYQTARLLLLHSLFKSHDSTFYSELKKSALYISSRSVLYNLIESDNLKPHLQKKERHVSITRKVDEKNSMEVLLDEFISSLPEQRPQRHHTINASEDYIGYLMQEQGLSLDTELASLSGIDEGMFKTGSRIVLTDKSNDELVKPVIDEYDDTDEGILTETMARIYIKQRKYDKAVEIIRRLSLKYPKKNRYFADQIRFLEKLIINNKNK